MATSEWVRGFAGLHLKRGDVSLRNFVNGLAWVFVIILATVVPAPAKSIRPGLGYRKVSLHGVKMEVFTYRPTDCTPDSLLLVLHRSGRNAESYRNAARPLADELCSIEVVPLFDAKRFPTWRYQKGGIVEAGTVVPSAAWTGNILISLVDWVRKTEGQPQLPYYLIGHAAGGQFLSRFAAFIPNQAQRIVIANASSYVLPNLTVTAPYGLKGVYAADEQDTALRAYLAQPVTIFLGQDDRGDSEQDESILARQEGDSRYERGQNTFRAAQAIAQAHSWPCNWRLVEAPGIAHDAGDMFASPLAVTALTGNSPSK